VEAYAYTIIISYPLCKFILKLIVCKLPLQIYLNNYILSNLINKLIQSGSLCKIFVFSIYLLTYLDLTLSLVTGTFYLRIETSMRLKFQHGSCTAFVTRKKSKENLLYNITSPE
jgi:hypothetical protein